MPASHRERRLPANSGRTEPMRQLENRLRQRHAHWFGGRRAHPVGTPGSAHVPAVGAAPDVRVPIDDPIAVGLQRLRSRKRCPPPAGATA